MSEKIHTAIFCILCVLVSLSLGAACQAYESEAITPEAVELGRPVDFNKDILPIFRANCLACHNRSKAEGELTLESQETILKGSSSGEIVVPGKPDESYLYNVAARIEESFMPPMPNSVQAKKLTPKQLWLLRQWIKEGAKPSTGGNTAAINWQKINSELKAVYSVDSDPWGRFVAAGRAGNVAIYDLASSGNVQSLRDPSLKSLSPQQQAHRDYVHAIAFHPSGEMIATSGYQVVKLWERDFASVSHNVSDLGPIQGAFVSPDRSLIAMQNDAGVIALTNGEAGQVRKLQVDATNVLHAIGGPENAWLLVTNSEGIASVVTTEGAVVAASESATGTDIKGTFTASNAVIVCSAEGTLQRFTVNADGKKLLAAETAKSDKGPVQQIAIAGSALMCRVEGAVVEIRNADNLSVTRAIQSSSPNRSAAISANGERITMVSPDGVAELWNAKDGKLVATLNSDIKLTRALQVAKLDKTIRDARVNVVKGQITEAEKRVTEQKDSLKKADEAVKKATEALAAARKKLAEETPKVAAAKKASDEKPDDAGLKKKLEEAQKAETTAKEAVAAAERGLSSANKSVELTKQAIARAEANVAAQKELLAVVEAEAKASADAEARATKAAAATIVSVIADFLADDLVATTTDDGQLRLWKTADGKPIDAFSAGVTSTPTSSVLSANGRLIVQNDKTVHAVGGFPVWKMAATLGVADGASEFADRVLALAFSPNGKVLAAGGGEASRSGELTLWNVESGKLLRRIDNAHSDTVCGLDISPDGKFLASAASDRFVKVFDLKTGEHVRNFEGHTHHVLDVAWKADGTRLVSAGGDNAIKVWNAETGEQTRTITTYQKQVTALEFIGTTDEFLSCSGDKRVFRHRAANGGTVREFKGCSDYVYCSCTTPDGAIVAAGCEDGILRVWNGADGKILSSFEPF